MRFVWVMLMMLLWSSNGEVRRERTSKEQANKKHMQDIQTRSKKKHHFHKMAQKVWEKGHTGRKVGEGHAGQKEHANQVKYNRKGSLAKFARKGEKIREKKEEQKHLRAVKKHQKALKYKRGEL